MSLSSPGSPCPGRPDIAYGMMWLECPVDPRCDGWKVRRFGTWEIHQIDYGLNCPHSIVAIDIDGDGLPDVIAGEMAAGGWDFPLKDNPAVYVYLNKGDMNFERVVLYEGVGVHEMRKGATGDRTILYAADELQLKKFPDMVTDVSMWTIPGST